MKTSNKNTADLCDLLLPLSDLAEYLGGKEIIPGILHALDAFAESEFQIKQYRKAFMLQAGHAGDFYNLAMAYNAVGIRRIEKAVTDWKKVTDSYIAYKSNAADPAALAQWDKIVSEEILPDVKRRLLEGGLSAGELSIMTDPNDNLCDPNSWLNDKILNDLNAVPGLVGSLVAERKLLSTLDKNKLAGVPDYGVSETKKYIIILVKRLVRVAIEICKTWRRIISKIVEIVWELVEKWVEEKVLERCRDGKPVPVAARRL
jgi:hypothetical protein